jgi:hypothetical protein
MLSIIIYPYLKVLSHEFLTIFSENCISTFYIGAEYFQLLLLIVCALKLKANVYVTFNK